MRKTDCKKIMKRIPGYNKYYACKDGRIYKKCKDRFRQLGEYHHPYSRYLGVYIYKNSDEKIGIHVHKLVASAFYRINVLKYYVFHKDKNISNNTPGNLYFKAIPKNKLMEKKENSIFYERSLSDYEAILKKYLNYDSKHYLWRKYEKLKFEKNFRLCYNWLRLLLSSRNLI